MPRHKNQHEKVQVLTRIGRLLKALTQESAPCGVRALAKRTDLAPSTAQRLMVGLQSQGFVEQTPERKWIPGNALVVLGLNALRNKHLASPDAALFKALEEETGGIFSLAIRIGDSVAILTQNQTHVLPLYETACGIALLGSETPDKLTAYMTRQNLTGKARETLFLQRESFLRNGWVGTLDDVHGYTVAVPVQPDEKSEATAALALLFAGQTSFPPEALKSLLAAAKALSHSGS